MYRLMLYFLWYFGLEQASLMGICFAGVFLLITCYSTNYLFAKIVHVKTNLESALITALILTLIVEPLPFFENLLVFGAIGTFAMASKYVFVINKKHIFNPTAFGVFFGGMFWVLAFLVVKYICIAFL
jgi:Na+-transporting NADH:ubiquinone oxidoreductase subunit NqrB